MLRKASLSAVLATLFVLSTSSPSAAIPDASHFGPWSAPVNLGATINSAFNDFGPGLSPDGKSLYFTSGRPGGFGQADLWVAQRENKNAPWGVPMNLGSTVNTAAIEAVPSFSRDGRWMFFNSDRPGGLGSNDIWVSFRANPNDDFGWQSPANLGAPVNSASFDAGPALVEHGNEDILYFNSDRLGTFDFYMSVREKNGPFGTPTLVTALNSPLADQRLTIRKDHREVFFFSTRVGSAANDLWTSTREDRDATWNTPTNLGSTVNSAANDFQPTLARDARTLIFASDRSGGSGGFDLYVTTRTKGD